MSLCHSSGMKRCAPRRCSYSNPKCQTAVCASPMNMSTNRCDVAKRHPRFSTACPRAVDRIQRKLGPERHAEIQSLLRKAFEDGDHQPWIERLLTWYYDPLYDRNLARKAEQVVWRGPREDAPQAIASLSGAA